MIYKVKHDHKTNPFWTFDPFYAGVQFCDTDGLPADSYATANGKKYHLKDCNALKGTPRTLTAAQAHADGLEPCGMCKP